MGTHTPPLDSKNKEEYLKQHLFVELRYLLAAATEWNIQNELNLQFTGYEVQVYAMDSAFLHARTLFEFFTQPTSNNYYGADEFLGHGCILKSPSYSTSWRSPLHAFLMHAQDRSSPVSLTSSTGAKHLNEMPVEFANEILRLWEEFESMLGKSSDLNIQKLEPIARKKRQVAIEAAAEVVKSDVAKLHANGLTLTPLFVF